MRIIEHPFLSKYEEALEDDCPLPVNFSTPLHFLSRSREEVLNEYLSMIPEHVSSELLQRTHIEKLLREKGVQVFIPDGEWKGVQGIDHVHIRTEG